MINITSVVMYFLTLLLFCLIACSTDKHEVFESYYDNGNIKYSAEVMNDQLDGLATSFHPNGMVESEIMYSEDLFHGQARFYNEQGTLLLISNYNKGILDGFAKRYDEQGRLVSSVIFHNGKKIGLEVLPNYNKKTIRNNYYDNKGKLYYYEIRGEGNKKLTSTLIPYIKTKSDTISLEETLQVNIVIPTTLKGETYLIIKEAGEVEGSDTIRSNDNKLFTFKVKPKELGQNSVKGTFKQLKHKEDTTTVNNLSFDFRYYTVQK